MVRSHMKPSVFHVIAVKDPLGPDYLGMAVALCPDGTTQTVITTDELGYMETYSTIEGATTAMTAIVNYWSRFRIERKKRPSEPSMHADEEGVDDEPV